MGDRCEEIDLVGLGIFEVSSLDRFLPEYLTAGGIAEVFQCDVIPGRLGRNRWLRSPRFGVAIGDVGYRALASPGGVLPTLEGQPEIAVEALHEAHLVLRSQGSMPLSVGSKFLLHSGQQDMMVNRWDQYIAVRDGVVEAVWDIPARGCHH